MSAIQQLHSIGQSLWLDNITRGMLHDGTLRDYIDRYLVTGLTSNPTIFERAIRTTGFYDVAIRKKAHAGRSGEALFYELALEDLTEAADLFKPIYEATSGIDGWVSLEVSPYLADDTAGSVSSAVHLHTCAERPNLFIKIPGNACGIAAIEELIFRGVPVNVTLLFSREQHLAVAEAFMRGIERRLGAGLSPRVESVASIFVSRWDAAANERLPIHLRNHLGIAVARQIYASYRELFASPRWRRLSGAGATAQRLLWASTGSKDPNASPTLYVEALAAPGTINTMPEPTLRAFAEHGSIASLMPPDGGDADQELAAIAYEGLDTTSLAARLQQEGAVVFCKSWHEMLACIAAKSSALKHDAMPV